MWAEAVEVGFPTAPQLVWKWAPQQLWSGLARLSWYAWFCERKKGRSTPVARRVLRGHELGSGHRTYLCLVIRGSMIL